MRTKNQPIPVRIKRPRSRFGYERIWKDERPAISDDRRSYWSVTRRPLPCLVFIAPILLVYELGVLWLGGAAAPSWRTGADAWMRHGLATLGVTDHWFLPLCLAMVLLVWQSVDRRDWRFTPTVLAGMAVESLLLAVALVGLSKAVDLGFVCLERSSAPAMTVAPGQSAHPAASLIGFLGAGVYEEALFRLLLVPLIFAALRVLQTPAMLATTLAVTASALLFSLAHHAGTPGEAFTWFAFIFRWLAGVFFAWVFIVRGFGVAVGTHTAYDVLVGWIGWNL